MSHARDDARGGRGPPPAGKGAATQGGPLSPRGAPPREPPPPERGGFLEKTGGPPRAEPPPADGAAVRQPPRLAANSPPIEVLRQRADGAELEITGKDCANRRSLGWYHKDLLVHRRIAERHRAADPKAFALGGSDLVAHPLPDQLPFELSK